MRFEKTVSRARATWKAIAGALLLAAIIPSPAQALCSGATAAQELRETDLVVRVRLVSEVNAWTDEPSAAYRARWGTGAPVVVYVLRVEEVFNGAPGPRIRLFQERNSGAFYLDADKDYLLFLNYHRPYAARPTEARGATYVSHACGQSRPWAEVQPADLTALQAPSSRR